MTKTSKQFSKTGLTLAILLAAFDGEGRALDYPTIIQQQCAASCVTTFTNSLSACAAKPVSCLDPAVDTLGKCITTTYTPCHTCPAPPPPAKALTKFIVQQDAVDCFNTFNAPKTASTPGGFPACTTFSCATGLLTVLSKCITGVSTQDTCTPPTSEF